MGKEHTMKRNWLKHVAVAVSLVAGSIGSTAFAGNKGGPSFSGPAQSFQGGTTAVRSIGNPQTFQPQIKTLNNNGLQGLQGIQLQGRQHTPSLNVPQLNNGIQGIQLKNQLDLTKKLGV